MSAHYHCPPICPKCQVSHRGECKPLVALLPADTIKQAFADEPELPDAMPESMWELLRNDRDAMTQLLRITVRQTKVNILRRLGL